MRKRGRHGAPAAERGGRAQVWLEYLFGICSPDRRNGKQGNRSAQRMHGRGGHHCSLHILEPSVDEISSSRRAILSLSKWLLFKPTASGCTITRHGFPTRLNKLLLGYTGSFSACSIFYFSGIAFSCSLPKTGTGEVKTCTGLSPRRRFARGRLIHPESRFAQGQNE